jgi:hypothetical protein
MTKNSIKNLLSGNKENFENKSSIIENTIVELKIDNINNDINNTNIYNINNDNDLKNYDNTPLDTHNPEIKIAKKLKKGTNYK